MLSLISKLQRRPERVRKQIAFLSSVAVTGVIVIFWVVSMSLNELIEPVQDGAKEPGPFEALTEGLSVFFSDTAETVQGAVGVFSVLSKQGLTSTEATATESVLP